MLNFSMFDFYVTWIWKILKEYCILYSCPKCNDELINGGMYVAIIKYNCNK